MLEMLREARELRGVSQRELSRLLGQQFTYIVKIERGTRRLDVVELVEICFQLGMSQQSSSINWLRRSDRADQSLLPVAESIWDLAA